MKRFTIKELRKIIDGCDENMAVLISAGDHNYRFAYAEVKTALEENHAYGIYTEDHGEDWTPEAEYGKRVPVVILG